MNILRFLKPSMLKIVVTLVLFVGLTWLWSLKNMFIMDASFLGLPLTFYSVWGPCQVGQAARSLASSTSRLTWPFGISSARFSWTDSRGSRSHLEALCGWGAAWYDAPARPLPQSAADRNPYFWSTHDQRPYFRWRGPLLQRKFQS